MADGVDQGKLIPDRIELPDGAGTIWFRDVETLTGRDLKEYRRIAMGGQSRGDNLNNTSDALLKVMVTKWEFRDLPNLPLPCDDPTVSDLLPMRVLMLLQHVLSPMIAVFSSRGYSEGQPDLSPGSPTQPGSA